MVETEVCIAGAGPVGLTLAMELASRGIAVTVMEQRTEQEISSPKSNHVSARSMEIYRRLGVADKIRAQGLPDDYPNDGVYATRWTGFELTRFRMPCRRERFKDSGYDDGNLPSAERAARVKGITPKSVFQIGGSGSVGTASLRGMPVLKRLRDAGFAVWPFDRPALKQGRPLVVEMYTRLNTGAVHKSNAAARAAYLLRKRREDPAYTALPRRVMEKARGSEDAFDALVSCMVITARRDEFAVLLQPKDPAYRVEGWTWAPGV